MKKIVSLLLILAMCMAMSACGIGDLTKAPKNKDVADAVQDAQNDILDAADDVADAIGDMADELRPDEN